MSRLCELGFVVHRRSPGMTLLKRRDRLVIVPDVTIKPEMLHAILRSADVSAAEFAGQVQRSGVYTKARVPECFSNPKASKR